MRREGGADESAGPVDPDAQSIPMLNPDGTPIRVHGEDLLAQMIQTLLQDAETPPTEVEGASEEFCDSTFFPLRFNRRVFPPVIEWGSGYMFWTNRR